MTNEERLERIEQDVAYIKGKLDNGLPGKALVCQEHARRLESLFNDLEPLKHAHWKLAGAMSVLFILLQLFGPNLRTLAGLTHETKTIQKP